MADDLYRVERALRDAAGLRLSPDDLGELVSRCIATVVPHESLNLGGVNPATGIISMGLWHRGHPPLRLAQRLAAYQREDLFPPLDLAGRELPVSIVHAAGVDGPASQASPAARVLAEHGVGSELVMMVRDSTRVWGALSLLREAGARPFDSHDTQLLLALVPSLITVVRGYVRATPLPTIRPALAPGVIVVGPDHSVRAISPQARAWLRELQLPRAIHGEWAATAVASEISMVARQPNRYQRGLTPLVCMPAAYAGHWVAAHAQPLDERCDGDIAVVIQAATGELLLPALSAWYGLTARERTVLDRLCDGSAPKQIARSLGLSTHTVNDHLKALFRKTNTSGRQELMAAVGV